MRKWIDLLENLEYPMADRDRDGWFSDGTYEAMGGKIVHMSPDEYLSRVRPLVIDEESEENIEDLMNRIENGLPIDPLKIYPDGKEDGRHRAHAAKRLGLKTVPVIVFPPKEMKPLAEAWHSTARLNGLTVDVMKNPTKAELAKARKAMRDPDTEWPFRAFIYPDGTLLVWDAYVATHSDMDGHLQGHLGGYLYLGGDSVMMNDLNYSYTEDDEEKPYTRTVRVVYEAIHRSNALRRLYGTSIEVIGSDHENVFDLDCFANGSTVMDQTFLDRYVIK